MQRFTFVPSSTETKISEYDQLSKSDSNFLEDMSVAAVTEPDSKDSVPLDQLITNFCDITMAASFACFPDSNLTNFDSAHSMPSLSNNNISQQTICNSDAYILETPQTSSFYKRTSERNVEKVFTEQALLRNPKSSCFSPIFDCDNLQSSDPIIWTEEFLNPSNDYYQMRVRNERNQRMQNSYVANTINGIEPQGGFCPSWWEKHPDTWTLHEVHDWIKYTIHQNTANPTYNNMDGFRDLTSGLSLHHMTYEEFLLRDPQYGDLLFHFFKQLLRVHNNASMGQQIRDDIFSSCHSCEANNQTEPISSNTLNVQTSPHDTFIMTQQNGSNDAIPYTSLIVPKYETITEVSQVKPSCPLANTFRNHRRVPFEHFGNPKRKPGRPRHHQYFQAPVGANKKLRSLPLWEFIYSTLQNAHFNPSIIKWEDEANGKFRFVNSEKFAKLWGRLKNNDRMNYEKLSRAMRHYYGKDIMERVEGRRLHYQFLNPALDRLRKKEDPDVPLSETQRLPEIIQHS